MAYFFIFTNPVWRYIKVVYILSLKNDYVKKSIFTLLGFLSFICSYGQDTYLPLGVPEYGLADRLQTLDGEWSLRMPSFSTIGRKAWSGYLNDVRRDNVRYGKVDAYHMERALSITGEWHTTADGEDGALPSKRPILKYFYKKQADFLHVNEDDFFLVLNPVVYFQGIKEKDNEGLRYINTRGVEVRGRLLDRIGFYSFIADNQEKALGYINNWADIHSAFPGADYYSNNKPAFYDYMMARGYVDVGALMGHLNVSFGFDKHFIGPGIRSLVLSDFSAPSTFLRLRAHWKGFEYESLYLELIGDYVRDNDKKLPKKYASIHQLAYKVSPWLSLGIFESTLYGYQQRLKLSNLVPVLFYNSVARSLGSDQKTALGLQFKAIPVKGVQLYGQGFFDGVELGQLGNGWWGNQWGLQGGLKYFDAFTIPNLDLQAEGNWVRPFTYASDERKQDYTHYNQPLAHPFGAGFVEWILQARYCPIGKLYIDARLSWATRGTDSIATESLGNDIFKPYDSRPRNEGYGTITGIERKSTYGNLNLAYEVKTNIFLEAGAALMFRDILGQDKAKSTYFYGGIRWNISRRTFDYY